MNKRINYLKPFTDVSIQSVKKEYHNNYWYNNDINIEYKVVTNTILNLNPKNVLEVGCGNGHNLVALNKYSSNIEVTGIDISSVGIEKAKEHHVGEFYLVDARDLLFTDDSFDVVFTVHALEQMKYYVKDVIKEIFRVCRGFVVLFEPFFVQQNFFGKWHIIRSEYAQGIPFFVENAGFRIVRFERLSGRDCISRGWNRTGLLVGEKLGDKNV